MSKNEARFTKEHRNTEIDLPEFLLKNLYDPDLVNSGWTLADAIDLSEDIRKHDGIACDPNEIYTIMLEFARQDAEDAER